ncbi:hypothetical protein [Sphingobium sp. HDIP04]|uniref:hypothetical protein n=1 Tax=Sphingobium sp. HDIP04 TaxID=428994 RepID=UPI0003877271|nr:hypothetical protein [Sphingobium sp. HDIP04]EQB03901.1 hypothetical protein L286_11085 [Sphingobium sp. HDIP04]
MNAITEVNQGGALAVQGGYDPYAAYGQEAASGSGDFLKFSKGEYLKGQNDDEVAIGTRLAANMAELSIGWIRWEDGKPAERRMGLLAQGHKPEARDSLGYTDQSQWEEDENGKPKDPWNFTNELPLANPETGEQMTFSASSKGGIGAIGNLCKAYGREYRAREGQVPIIELQRDSYKHKVYGKTYVPLIPIVAWVDNGTIPQPAKDEEEEPAAKTATGSKTRF